MLTLLDRHGIHVIRLMLVDLAVSAFLKPSTLALTIPSASSLGTTLPHTKSLRPTPARPTCRLTSPHHPTTTSISSWSVDSPSNAHHCPCSLQVARKSRKHSLALGCSKASWGTRVRDGCGCPSISLDTTDIRDTWWGDVGANLVAAIDHLGLTHLLQDRRPTTRDPSLVPKPQPKSGGNNVYRASLCSWSVCMRKSVGRGSRLT
jgi:hypothetical protein